MAALDGMVALVTGAGPSIGQACAGAHGRAGADVVLAARDRDRLGTLAVGLAEETGRTVVPLTVDVGDLASCACLVDQVLERFGWLDVLLNVATGGGGTRLSSAANITESMCR